MGADRLTTTMMTEAFCITMDTKGVQKQTENDRWTASRDDVSQRRAQLFVSVASQQFSLASERGATW
jgi:hypothetical protein|eukprot:scaffold430_cov187-Alexandrium_tamarense.AAC.15